jgi:hypothetical protein
MDGAMMDFKGAFKAGKNRADLKTYRQVVVRGMFYGGAIAFVIWGPFSFWVRLLLGLAGLFVYGVIAASTRLGRWM